MGTLHSALTGSELHISKTNVSTGTPVGNQTAGVIGEFYWDSTNNKLYIAEATGTANWINAGVSLDEFIELTDTPSTFSGQGGLVLQVNSGETAVEFGQDLTTTGGPTFGSMTVTGDLTVNGTTTTINSTTLTIDDNNIELGSVASPTDITADGGGWTLKGDTDKTITWTSGSDNWTSNQNWNLSSGLEYKINDVSVLSATGLGFNVLSSSLTSVGILASLQVTGTFKDSSGDVGTSGQVLSSTVTGTNWIDEVGNVSTSDTLTSLTMLVGNGGQDIQAAEGTGTISVTSDFEEILIKPASLGESALRLLDSSSAAVLSMTYDDTNSVATIVSLVPVDFTSSSSLLVRAATQLTLDSITSNMIFKFAGAQEMELSSSALNLATGNEYQIDGTSVLNATTLGSAVVSSSLTSVGTLTSGVWNGTTVAVADGGTGVTTSTGSGNVVLSTAPTIIIPTFIGTVTGPSGSWISVGMKLGSGDEYFIDSVGVLNTTTLGSTVLNSSLTSLGTLTSLAVTGTFADSSGDVGTSGQILSSTVTGTNWISEVGNVNSTGTPVDNQIAIWTDSDTIEGDSDLTFDGLNLTAGGSISAGTEFQQGGATILVGDATNSNIFVGLGTGASTVTGQHNTVLGDDALAAITSGGFNTAIGSEALEALTTGSSNTAIGIDSLLLLTIGIDNVAIGDSALANLVEGDKNTVIGALAGANIISADGTGENTFIGYNSGVGITTGVQNTIIGANVTGLSSTLSNNIILADGAGVTRLQFDSSGNATFSGDINITSDTNSYQIGGSTILAEDITAGNLSVGVDAGLAHTGVSSGNVAVGSSALIANTTGKLNTAVGFHALLSNTIGLNNTSIGNGTLLNNLSGDSNVALGRSTFENITTGSKNTAIGSDTGMGITTGDANTILGANVTGLTSTLSNNIIIADGDGVVRLQFDSSGNGSVGAGFDVGGALTTNDIDSVGAMEITASTNMTIDVVDDLTITALGTNGISLVSSNGDLSITANNFVVDGVNNLVGINEVDPQVELDVTGIFYADGIHSPFGGMGRMQNLLAYSEDMSQSSVWTDPLSVTTITSNNATAPNGETTADTVTWTGSGIGLRQVGLTLSASTEYTLSFWAQAASGTETVNFDISDGPNTSAITIDTTMKRYVVQITSASGSPSFLDVNPGSESAVINFWGWQLVLGSDPMPYVRTEANKHEQDIFGESVAGLLRVNSGEDDPNGTETGTGGDIFGQVDGAMSNLFFSKEATTGTEWQPVSILPTTVNQLFSTAEYEDLGSGSVITTTATRSLRFHASVTSSTRHTVSSQSAELQFIDPTEGNQMIYTGTSTFITAAAGGDITSRNGALIAGVAGTQLFDYAGEGDLPGVDIIEIIQSSNLAQWDLGTISRVSTGEQGPIVRIKDTNIISTTDPLVLDSVVILEVTSCLFDDTSNAGSGGPLFSIKDSSYKEGRAVFLTNGGRLYSGESLVRIDAGLPSNYRVEVIDSVFIIDSGGSIFDTSGSTGSFTVVVDNSISATTITGVTDSSGVASFTHAGTSPFLNSLVTVSGFTTNTDYNTTGIVTATTATTFEIDYVAFGTSEAGSYAVTGVTVTATAHGNTIGTGVTLDTQDAIAYDGGFLIYNIQTNSFDIPATFTADEEGTWSTKGLDQTDPRVNAFNNPETADSKVIAFGGDNANATSTLITDGTYVALVVSTFDQDAVSEKFKLTNVTAGIWTLTAIEDFKGTLTGGLWAIKSGSTANYRFAMSTNGAVPTFATVRYAPMEVKTTKVSIPLEFTVDMSEGDTIQIMVAGDGTSDNLTITDIIFGIK